jgi:hypothetical protein
MHVNTYKKIFLKNNTVFTTYIGLIMKVMDKFYQELGHLFYAVASVDKKIAKEEIDELKKCVRSYWLPLEDSVDEFGTDAAYQIESVFEWLMESGESTNFAFHEFEEYHEKNKKHFDGKINEMVLGTCQQIATSFHATNKAEAELLNKIKALLK